MAEGRNAPATALADAPAAMEQQDRSQNLRDLAVVAASSKTFIAGAAILLFWILVALFWGAVVPYGPQALDPTASLAPPSAEHWFGTDNLGRDVFSRVLAGATSVLTVAPLGTALGMLGGIAVGLVTGYYRGRVDDVVMRVVDALLAFPLIIIAVLVLSVLGPSKVNVILVIGVVFTPIVARTVRSAVLSEREREYVAAARLRGESGLYIMVSEILPNILSPIAVEATIRLGYAIFTSATLSFLSLGIQEPSPDWGLTISIGRVYLQAAPWMVLFPALALATLVVAVNLVADGLLQAVED
ncbi:MAG: Dipeptide transport system permease protein DppC [uncultured Rubrobacteraceae bacterium]|uniref:Dipeptide transport system permease protein DppC n=1 Tax=uncultured Rubrobacteraceae bacterium TaxID=349277 RepID=A0A6J4QBU3_9ACTN|nr:MAG: Dipeptide transport system permease protein DppC [uncultured Rubrobacteraceae bacterium]